MKKRDYYILFILIMLVVFAAYYRKEYCTNIEAQEKVNGKTNSIQKTEVIPTSSLTDSISSRQV